MARCACVLLLMMIGCSGDEITLDARKASGSNGPSIGETLDPYVDASVGKMQPDATTDAVAESSAADSFAREAASDVVADRRADTEASAARDAALDAGADAVKVGDASADATPEDASQDASALDGADGSPDSAMDAAVDANPNACSGGDYLRCNGYAEEQCISGVWQRTSGQSCCHTTGRFNVSQYVATDSTTGLEWSRHALYYQCGFAGSSCTDHMVAYDAGTGWRTPTAAEMGTLTIGPLTDAGKSVCSPTMDQDVFIGEGPGLYHGLDRYYDFGRGREGPEYTSDSKCYAICVR